MKRKILRFRRVPRETGLRAICQGERGYDLFYGEDKVGSASPYGRHDKRNGFWYWYGFGENTSGNPTDLETAKNELRDLAKALIKSGELK